MTQKKMYMYKLCLFINRQSFSKSRLMSKMRE